MKTCRKTDNGSNKQTNIQTKVYHTLSKIKTLNKTWSQSYEYTHCLLIQTISMASKVY